MELFLDALLDALIDGVKMLPFLYLAYQLIEWLERHQGESIEEALSGGGAVRLQRRSLQPVCKPGHYTRHGAGGLYRHQR